MGVTRFAGGAIGAGRGGVEAGSLQIQVPPPVADWAGGGRLVVERVAGRSVVTRAMARSPLKLLTPASRGRAAWIFASTYGGGLLPGDQINLSAEVCDDAAALLTTQAATKVYRSGNGSARQALDLTIGAGAFCVVAPDPVCCYAGARFEQRQRFHLERSSALVMVDWFTGGRYARGERWEFARYASRNEVWVDGEQVFRDVLDLDPSDGELAALQRLGSFNCFATVVLLGPALQACAEALLEETAASPARPGADAPGPFSASPLRDGVVLRVAGASSERIGHWLAAKLGFVAEMLGEDPWRRKW